MTRRKLDPAMIRVKVTCDECGRDYLATPEPDGWMKAVPGSGACECGAPVIPHYTDRQLDQLWRLQEENPDAQY